MPRPAALALLALAGAAPARLLAQQPTDALAAFVQAHCVECHGGDTTKGGLDLTRTAADATQVLWRWQQLALRVRAGEMPPATAEQPSAA
ncbi:MAG: c-type cytochrome domain-containing protein, partial [Planctomycetota bacterium]